MYDFVTSSVLSVLVISSVFTHLSYYRLLSMDEIVQTVTSVLFLDAGCMRRAKFSGVKHLQSVEEAFETSTCAETPDGNAPKALEGVDELGPEFNMDTYDEEDANDKTHLFSVIDADLQLCRKKDDYMNDEVSDSEDEEYHDIKESDVLFVAANVEEDACTIEVYLHDTFDGGMYVHHDFLISSYPLCLEYIPSLHSNQSLLAVGAFDPKIDVWELSVHDPIEPLVQLGKRKGHSDAVISLTLSPQTHQILASGSADCTVRLWDISKETSLSTLKHHSDKVQSVKWHPVEAGILLSSAYDKRVVVTDQRSTNAASAVFTIGSDPECTVWSRHSPTLILVSDEQGHISAYDMRKIGEPLWRIQAHTKGACTSFTDVLANPDILISAGTDGCSNVWKTTSCSSEPALVVSQDLKAGPLFSVSSCNEDPSLAVFGASCPVLWNITNNDVICKVFPTLPGADQPNLPDVQEDNDDEELDD
jgi:periodic tryptophan protein 1